MCGSPIECVRRYMKLQRAYYPGPSNIAPIYRDKGEGKLFNGWFKTFYAERNTDTENINVM